MTSAPIARAWLFLPLLLVVAGCGSTGRQVAGADPFAQGADAAAEIRIRVRNSNFYDATLTALGDMGRRRLGTVGGNQTATFTTPWTFTGALRLQIDLLAGPTCTTEAITVSPGDQVTIDIASDFSLTTYCR
jgi:hypothetical protein